MEIISISSILLVALSLIGNLCVVVLIIKENYKNKKQTTKRKIKKHKTKKRKKK
jgi:hypothetical protein|tara:strand:- start:62 stop:223 length:162 start_codon:yes stop_codon:yes gene_type:complete